MDQIISYIDDLVKNGSAYNVDGDVFFRVNSVPHYGELANVNIDDLVVGARIEENSKKESPLDFALWKKTDVGIQWDSPWGKGRPGWHTECCVMIDSIFGNEKIDIHGGGFDLKFPHHENEIAQAKAHDHNKLANIWMHNGFVNFGDEKMSKSLGNVVLAKDAIAKYGANAMRFLILTTHYRAPVQFTEETISSTQNELLKISKTYSQLAVALQVNGGSLDKKDVDITNFLSFLADDFNTANALTELFGAIKAANMDLRKNPLDISALERDFGTIKTMIEIFGLDIKYPHLSEHDIELYNKYLEFKRNKQFDESDKIRAQLIEKNII
jgi:cysteinyl-tRNA synthetase